MRVSCPNKSGTNT